MESKYNDLTWISSQVIDQNVDKEEPLLSGTRAPSYECSQTQLEIWSKLLNEWQMNPTIYPKVVIELERNGIPEVIRGVVWQLLAGCEDDNNLLEKYRVLVTLESTYEKSIEKDICRTFPANKNFKGPQSLGQISLYRVCKAYANYDFEIGYCQGFSFIIASLLLHMPEEQAFCVFVKIMNNYGLKNLFKSDFEQLNSNFYLLDRAFSDLMPQLHSFLSELGVETHMFATQWFLTLFTAKFPLYVVFNIIDLFLVYGMEIIFKVSLGLLLISRNDLLKLNFEGVLNYFHVLLPKKFTNEENGKLLIKIMKEIDIQKLQYYQKERQIFGGLNKFEDPINRLEKENKCLNDSIKRLELDNNKLSNELLLSCDSKIKLHSDLDIVENKVNQLTKELEITRSLLSEVENEKKRLEDETECLKDMFRKELEKADIEIAQKDQIIAQYELICAKI
jgi:hypothetical protein